MISAYASPRQHEWNTRALCCRYTTMTIQAHPIQVRHGSVAHHQKLRWAFGMLANGEYEGLGTWLEPLSHARNWHEVFKDLNARGVEQIRIVASNESADLRDALRAAFPSTSVLPSIGRLFQQSLSDFAPRDRESAGELLAELAAARTAEAACVALSDIAATPWGKKHPATVERWRVALDELGPFYALPPRLRRTILAGDDAAQQLQQTLSRALARHGAFANPQAAISFVVDALTRAERRLNNLKEAVGASAGRRPRSANGASSTGSRSGAAALGPRSAGLF